MKPLTDKEIVQIHEALFNLDKNKKRFTDIDDFEFIDDYSEHKNAMELFNLNDYNKNRE